MTVLLAQIANFGADRWAIWMFAAGVLGVLLVAVLLMMGVATIRRLLDL